MQQAQTCYEPPSAALPTRFVCPPPHRPATPPVSCMNIRHAYRGSRARTIVIDICKSALLVQVSLAAARWAEGDLQCVRPARRFAAPTSS